jgi:hypothetical protein
MRIPAVLALIFAMTFSPAWASEHESSAYAGDFTYLGVGGRALGMGGSFVALSDDVTATYWNPAGLSGMRRTEIGFMHSTLYGLDSYDFIALASPIKGIGKFGFCWLRVGIDDIMYTGVPRPLMPASLFNRPYVERTFSTSNNLFSLSYAFRTWKGMDVGLSAKLIYVSTIWGFNALGIGGDLGLIYRRGDLSFGMMIQDFTRTKLFWNTAPQPPQTRSHVDVIKPNLKLGIAYSRRIERLRSRVIVSVDVMSIYNFEKRVGVEWTLADTLSLRFGIQERSGLEWRNDITAGAGLRIGFVSGSAFSVDYAFLSSQLGNSNRISLTMRI